MKKTGATLVLAQIAPVLGDVEANLERHLDAIRRASRSGADGIVFPELSLTGYLLQDLVPDCAQTVGSSPVLDALARASKRTAVIAGFVEQGRGGVFYNSAACFVRGEVRHVHRKVYLPTYGMFDEGRYFGAGEVIRTFEAPWGRTGILICEDFWHISSSWLLALEGMDTLIIMANSPTKGIDASEGPPSRETWVSLGQVVARFLTAHVVYVNRTGYEDGWNYGGGSYAVGPSGKVTAEGKLFKADTVRVSLESPSLRARRLAFPLLRDEKLDLVRRELDRIASERYGADG